MTKKAATQELTEGISYEERVSKKEDIRQRLQVLKGQNGAVSTDAFNKKAIAHEAAMALQRAQTHIKNENERMGRKKDSMDPGEKDKLQKLTTEAVSAGEEAEAAEKRKAALTQEINKLSNELENFGYLLGVDEVLRYQKDVANAEKQVADFQTLIAEQEGVIKKASQAVPGTIDALLKQREDLLANIVIGTATGKDLDQIDRKIEERNKALDGFNKIAANTYQVIAGLQRKLDMAEDKLNHLRSKREEIVNEFLMGQAELLGEEYIKLSTQLIDKFKELTALDLIMGYPSRLFGPGSNVFAIPSLRLKAFDGLVQYGDYGQIGAARAVAGPFTDPAVIRAAVDKMKAEISATGINL